MLVKLTYTKKNKTKKVELSLDNKKTFNSNVNKVKLLVNHENQQKEVNRILGSSFDFVDSYKLTKIKVTHNNKTIKMRSNKLIKLMDTLVSVKPDPGRIERLFKEGE